MIQRATIHDKMIRLRKKKQVNKSITVSHYFISRYRQLIVFVVRLGFTDTRDGSLPYTDRSQ